MSKLTEISRQKLRFIMCCPICYTEFSNTNYFSCIQCKREFNMIDDIPIFIADKNLIQLIYQIKEFKKTTKEIIKSKIPIPDERLWTSYAKQTIRGVLEKVNPDFEETIVVNMGSGVENYYRKIFGPYHSIIRIGIPHDGDVNAYGDAMALPFKNDSVDLFISSSVIEHLSDPEKAVSELFRTIKPGGFVYAEIPFIGAYHMAPHDYQRYTITGIELLFNRNGFILEKKGICSGPITALVLLFQHAIVEAIPWAPFQYVVRLILTWILHPLKYFDFIFGQSKWGEYIACNFFYLGRKPN